MMTPEASFGSLSGSLLARKGGARPAMRPQAYRFNQGDRTAAEDDCGWNDMGGAHMLTPEQRETLLPSADGRGAQPQATPEPAQMRASADDIAQPGREEHAAPVASHHGAPAQDFAEDEQALAEQSAFLARLARESEPDDALSIPEPARRERPPVTRAAPGSKAKSAFTLRLDGPQHLRLRLATAFAHKSAQKLVAQAVDEYLSKHFPDLPA
ncbi:hypothetical protein ACSMXM_06130 [Pacificimonas sp. ICDLI1SI03]